MKTKNPSGIYYTGDLSEFDLQGAFVATLPANLAGSEALMDALAEQLKFPASFQRTWESVSDYLHDFHWRSEAQIILIHRDIPLVLEEDLRTYLDILYATTEDWQALEGQALIVVFPPKYKALVQQMLHDN